MLYRNVYSRQKWLLFIGISGCLLFVALFMVLGMMRHDYNPLRYPVSSLSIGKHGWMQKVNFIICGSSVLISALGFKNVLHHKSATSIACLVGMSGTGLIGAGVFNSDPVYGYPGTEPFALSQFTVTGHLHDLFSLLFFICLPTACFKMSRVLLGAKRSDSSIFLKSSAIGMLIAFVIAGAGFKQVPGLVLVAGLFQRLSIILGLMWLVYVYSLVIKSSHKKRRYGADNF